MRMTEEAVVESGVRDEMGYKEVKYFNICAGGSKR